MLSEITVREREKRIELEALPPECEGVKPSKIVQGFIKEVKQDNKPLCDVRIRNENGRFTLTAKHRPTYSESTTSISKDTFETLWRKARSKQEKARYKLQSGWVVDSFKDGRVVAEYEYGKDKLKAFRPAGFKVKEILN